MTNELDDIFQGCKIGDKQTLKVSSLEQNRDASISLVSQANYTLDIVCRDFDHALYDNLSFYNVVKQLATRGSKSKIRILIQDSEKAIKQGHQIVGLARRLSSFIEIRIQGKSYKEFNEAWLIIDSKAWIRRPLADRYIAEVDFSAARQLKEIGGSFNDMWNNANNDPNLRRLSI